MGRPSCTCFDGHTIWLARVESRFFAAFIVVDLIVAYSFTSKWNVLHLRKHNSPPRYPLYGDKGYTQWVGTKVSEITRTSTHCFVIEEAL